MKISAVVCTKDRPELTGDCIRALIENKCPELEILIVDQSTDGSTAAAISEILSHDSRVRYIPSKVIGVSHGRNIAIRQSTGDVIAFTDDDCIPDPNWVQSIKTGFESNPEVDAIFGRCVPYDKVLPGERPIAIKLDTDVQYFSGKCNPWKPGHGNNMAFRREIFDKAGCFDEMLGPGREFLSSEDADLTYRVLKAGLRVMYSPDAVIRHRQFRHGSDFWQVEKNYGIGSGAMYVKHLRCGDLYMINLILQRWFQAGLPHILYGLFTVKSMHIKLGWYRIIFSLVGMKMSVGKGIDHQTRVFTPNSMRSNSDGE